MFYYKPYLQLYDYTTTRTVAFKKHSPLKKYFLFVVLSSFSVGSFGQFKESQEINKLFKAWNQPNVPGGAIGIIKEGKLIYSKGYGIGDLEHTIKISPSSVFNISAESQQFITFSLLLLEEQGKLNLDDTVQKYLPDFPEYNAPLTIRQFIHHTSGIRHYGALMHLKGRSNLESLEANEIYELIKNQKALNSFPGKKFSYSNSGYFLLTMIIEKISNQSLNRYAQEHIFGPLGMENTFFYDNNTALIKNKVFSYRKKTNEHRFDNLNMRTNRVEAGLIYSTIEDLFLWDQNFYNNKLGKGGQNIIKNMYKEGLLNNGESSGFAYGLRSGTYKGLKEVSNGGRFAGYRSEILRFPEENFSVIILANRGDAIPWTMSYKIADVLLKEKFLAITKKKENKIDNYKRTDIKEKFSLKQITGDYEIEPGKLLKITIKNDSLQLEGWVEPLMLINTKGNTYRAANYPIFKFIFSELKNTSTQKLTVSGPSLKLTSKRKERIDFSTLNLTDYTGSFYNEEIDATHIFFIEDNQLKVKIANYDEKRKLAPFDTDIFNSENYLVHFTRTNGEINGFELKTYRITHLKFEKI